MKPPLVEISIFRVAHVLQLYKMTPIYALLAALALTAVLSLVSLLTIFVSHLRSAHFDVNYKDPYSGGYGPWGRYAKGTFDLETWTCDLAAFEGSPSIQTFSKQCRIEQAARWALVPFCIVSVLAAGLGWWAMSNEKANVDECIKLKEVDRRQYV